MQSTPISAAAQGGRFGRFCGAVLLLLGLSACSQPSPQRPADRVQSALAEPVNTVVDFRLVDCERIWEFSTPPATDNPLYWLRAIDCAARLSPADARAEARSWPGDDWQSAFKQAVLLNNGNITPVERRQYLHKLDSYGYDYPPTVRPLLLMWREGQGSLLQLSEARTRYARLQENSDAELDALRQQQIALKQDLSETRRKLDTLTDIERQLSSRRAPDASDGSAHGSTTESKSSEDANP